MYVSVPVKGILVKKRSKDFMIFLSLINLLNPRIHLAIQDGDQAHFFYDIKIVTKIKTKLNYLELHFVIPLD